MDLFYYVNMIICCFFSSCFCSWYFYLQPLSYQGDPPLTLVEGIQVSFVEVITLCYIFRASVVCSWWIYTILVGASPPTLLERAVLSRTWFRVGCTVYRDFFPCYVCLFYCVHKIYQFCYCFTESALPPSFCTLWLGTMFSSFTLSLPVFGCLHLSEDS